MLVIWRCHAPIGPQLIVIFSPLFDYLERRTFEQLTQVLRQSGSGSGEREILAVQQQKQQGLLADKIGRLKNHDDFVVRDSPSTAQRATQAITLGPSKACDLGLRLAAILVGPLDQTRDA